MNSPTKLPTASAPASFTLAPLTEGQQARFTAFFLSTWLSNGFGAMGKRETDLLIFACLQSLLDPLVPWDSYTWARRLKVTPSRAKGLRLEAYLKYCALLVPEGEASLLKHFLGNLKAFKVEGLRAVTGLGSAHVLFLAEDPVVKLELEQKVKELGGIPRYEENREVLALDLITFLNLVDRVTSSGEGATIKSLASKAVRDEKKMEQLQGAIEGVAYANLGEGEKLLKFLDLLGNTFAEKPMKLMDHMKTIFKSQTYREKAQPGSGKA